MSEFTKFDVGPHGVTYDQENDVLNVVLNGELSADQFVEVDGIMNEIFNDRPPRTMWDIKASTGEVPKEMRDSIKEQLKSSRKGNTTAGGYSAVVGANAAIRIVIKVLNAFSGNANTQFFNDSEKALGWLKEVR